MKQGPDDMVKAALIDAAYEMYKEDWKAQHDIGANEILEGLRDTLSDYLDEIASFPDDYGSFEEYQKNTNEYRGMCYACKDEFIDAEFQDADYMHNLLQDEWLIKAYDSLNAKNMMIEYSYHCADGYRVSNHAVVSGRLSYEQIGEICEACVHVIPSSILSELYERGLELNPDAEYDSFDLSQIYPTLESPTVDMTADQFYETMVEKIPEQELDELDDR